VILRHAGPAHLILFSPHHFTSVYESESSAVVEAVGGGTWWGCCHRAGGWISVAGVWIELEFHRLGVATAEILL
jgi:hypothetical protein